MKMCACVVCSLVQEPLLSVVGVGCGIETIKSGSFVKSGNKSNKQLKLNFLKLDNNNFFLNCSVLPRHSNLGTGVERR